MTYDRPVTRIFTCCGCGREARVVRVFPHGCAASIVARPDDWHEIDDLYFLCDRHTLSVDGKLWVPQILYGSAPDDFEMGGRL